MLALKKRKFVHNKIEYNFRWAYFRHDASFQSNRLENYLSSVYKNENLDLFNNNHNIILNNCSTFRVKYLKKLSAIKILQSLKKNGLIWEFDVKDDLYNYDFLKDFIITAKQVEINVDRKIIELESKYRTEPENLKKEVTEIRKKRHDYVEKKLIETNKFVIATEIPICDEMLYILGHIDILSFSKNRDSMDIGVIDYKPEVENGKSYDFIKTLPQVCMYALLLKKKLRFKNIRLFCVSFNSEKGWIYNPDLVLKLPGIIKDYYDERYFNGNLLDVFGNPRDYDFFDWVILSKMYALHNPVNDFFSVIKFQIAQILNLNTNSSLDAIASKILELKNKLKQNSPSFNKKQRKFLRRLTKCIRLLTDKSNKKEVDFSEFYYYYKFNPNNWRSLLTRRNRSYLETLNEIDKLRILFWREKLNTINYDYYVLSIIYNLKEATYSDINFLLAKYYRFYSFNKAYLSTLLKSLFKKKFIIKLDTGNYSITSKAKTNLEILGIKKDPTIFYSRNKHLLRNRDFAFKFLVSLKEYGKYKTLTLSIFEEIRKKIRDYNNKIISVRNLKANVRFLFSHKFLEKDGQISSITHKIIQDIQDKDSYESNIQKIRYGRYILQAIYSLNYPRFTYIDYFLNKICNIQEENTYFRYYLDTSINLLLSNGYIKKHGVIYLLTDKGREFIVRNKIKLHKKLRLFGNLKELKNYCQYGYHILEVLKHHGELSKKQISIKIPTESITGILDFTTLRENLNKLEKMNYVYKNFNHGYDLTSEGKELFNIPEFIKNLPEIEVYDKVIPTLEQIAKIPDISIILQSIFSMEKAPRSYIDYFCSEKGVSNHSVNQALDILCRGKLLEIKKRFYALTSKGLIFLITNGIIKDDDIYIRSLVKYFNDYLNNGFVILKYILDYGSLSFTNLLELTRTSQTTLDRNLKSLINMNFINREKGVNPIYIYYLTGKGRDLYNNLKIKKFLN